MRTLMMRSASPVLTVKLHTGWAAIAEVMRTEVTQRFDPRTEPLRVKGRCGPVGDVVPTDTPASLARSLLATTRS